MTAEHWQDPLARAVIAYIDGSRDPDRDARGRPLLGDDLLVLVNGYWEPLDFTLPPIDAGWRLALDTADPAAAEAPVPPGMPVTVRAVTPAAGRGAPARSGHVLIRRRQARQALRASGIRPRTADAYGVGGVGTAALVEGGRHGQLTGIRERRHGQRTVV
jgi:hypothetical protein